MAARTNGIARADAGADALSSAATDTGYSNWKPTPRFRPNTSCCVHYLGEPDDLELERKIGVYLRRIQGEHGGWPLFHDGAFDICASVKAYFALKMIGDRPDAPHMVRAREAILAHGGARRRTCSPGSCWRSTGRSMARRADDAGRDHAAAALVPVPPVRMSYWARTVLVPLTVLEALKSARKEPERRRHRGVVHDPAGYELPRQGAAPEAPLGRFSAAWIAC